MSSNQAAQQNAHGSDMLKTMLMKQIQQSQANSGPTSASAMQGGSRMGIRPGLIKREPGQHPMRPQAVQSAIASGVTPTQSMIHAQSMQQHGHNPMSVLASMAQQNMSRPSQMSSSQPQPQMPLGQQQQAMRVSSPQMTPRSSVPRMPQNLTPQQQAMMMRYQQQQQVRQQQMQAGGRPPGPFPGQMINRPRMPMIKQEPGTGINPQMALQQKEATGNLSRGPVPANVRPPHGPSSVQAPMPGSLGIRGIPPVRIKQEGVPNSGTTQRQLPSLGAQRFPAQGQMMGSQPPRSSQHGLPPGSQGNPQAGIMQGSMMGRDQPVQQNVLSQRQARGQMRPRMQQPTGPMPRLQGQVQDMNFMNPRVPTAGLHGLQHKQMNSKPLRPSMAPSSMSDKNLSLGAPASQSQSTSFMQMLTDDSDLMNLMSTQSQYTGVGGLGQNQGYSSSGVRPGGPPNTSAGNVSFMQLLLNDSRTPPPDPSDQRQNYMAEQQMPNQMRMPMPTPPMSDPMSGSPNEFVGNQLNRGNIHPVSSGVSSQMSSNGMPYQSGVRECHLPPPYPGGSSIPPQRPGGRNQNNIMYPSSSAQMYSGQQGMSHMGQQHQMSPTQMSMSGGTSSPFNLHQQQLGNQGLQPYDQGFPNPMGHSQHGGVSQQLPFARDPLGDPFSPSIIPPNRDIGLNPPLEARVQGMMERAAEYMDMDNMHEDMVEPIVIAPIDERIASKMDRCNARQDMMSLQNMVSRLENQEQGFLPPANQNVPLPPVANTQRCDPLYNAAENRSPDVQLVSVHGEFNLHNVPVVEDKPPRSNLSAKSHKLLKSMKKLKLVLKKIDLKGRTTVKLGRKKSKRKDKERRKRRRKEHRSKKWRHIDRSHIYERRRKKRESISVSSDSETEDSEYERRRRRKRRRHSEKRRKRRSLSSDGSYVSEDDLDMGCRPKKRRTRAKKPQYYLGSDDEFEYENSLTGYMSFETPFDIAWTETSLGSKFRSKKDKDESDLEFDPGEFTSVEEEYSSDASSSDSDTAASDSDETRSGREVRISKKKQTSLKVAQRFRSSSSDEVNETFLFDSDDEEYTPAVIKRGRKSQSRSGTKRRRMSSASSAVDESPRKKRQKKNLKRKQRKALIFSSDGEDIDNEQVLQKPQKATKPKRNAKSGKQDVPVKNAISGKQDVPVMGNPPNKVKAKPAAKSTSKGGKRVRADSTKNTTETRVTRGRSASMKVNSQENESEATVTRRTRSQLRKDSLNLGSKTPDADKASNVVSTSEEVSADKNAQNYNKSCDSQAEVSSTSENPRRESDFTIPDCDQSPKEVTSTSESKKADDEKLMACEPECQTVPEDNPVSSVAIIHHLSDINTKSPKVVLKDIYLNEPVVSGSVRQTEDVPQIKGNSDELKESLSSSSHDELSADNETEKEQHTIRDQEASKNALDEEADNTTDACNVALKNIVTPAGDDSLKPHEENITEWEKRPAADDSLKQLEANTSEYEKTPTNDDSLKQHEENTTECEPIAISNTQTEPTDCNTICSSSGANVDKSEVTEHKEAQLCVDGLSGTQLEGKDSNKECCDTQKDPEMMGSTPRVAAEALGKEEQSPSNCKEKDGSPNTADCANVKTDCGSEKMDFGSEKADFGDEKNNCGSEKTDCDSERNNCDSEKTDSGSEKNNCDSEKTDCDSERNNCFSEKTDSGSGKGKNNCSSEKTDCDSKEGDIAETTEASQPKTSEETPGDTNEQDVLGCPSPTQRITETPEETSG